MKLRRRHLRPLKKGPAELWFGLIGKIPEASRAFIERCEPGFVARAAGRHGERTQQAVVFTKRAFPGGWTSIGHAPHAGKKFPGDARAWYT